MWKSANSAEAATGRGKSSSYIALMGPVIDVSGLSEYIRDAYSFLCHNYSLGDDIVLIGFSRGAYTARCLANLVYDVGILTKRGLTSLDSVYRHWEGKMESKPRPDSFRLWALRKTLKLRHMFTRDDSEEDSEVLDKLLDSLDETTLHPNVRIKACAVWDTVASLHSNKLSFVGADLCPNIDYAFQALALNEERILFQPLVWELDAKHSDDPQVLKQCWFLGDHSNVGGGKEDNTIAGIPLLWMMAQLIGEVGLEFDYDILKDFSAEDRAERIETTTRRSQSISFGHNSIAEQTQEEILCKTKGDTPNSPRRKEC